MWHAWKRRGKLEGFDGQTRRREITQKTRHMWEVGIQMDL
jgi:hypothetical protein